MAKQRARAPFWFALPLASAFWLAFLCFYRCYITSTDATLPSSVPRPDPCAGRYIYVHDLPTRFNSDILRHCRTLSQWTDMCLFTSNAGLGPPLDNSDGVFSDSGWHATNQFALDVIFHNRMAHYECLTNDSSLAAAVFVPFYAGLDVARHLWGHNSSVRDAAALDLVRWLRAQPEWSAMGGRDHFLVAGRITWDFRRLTDEEPSWGSKLLLLPEARNMTTLVIEASPWHSNDVAVPYPTYFHPSTDAEILRWQHRVLSLRRPYLFSFAGAPRPNQTQSIRNVLFDQCRRASGRCKLLECDAGASRCHSPASVMGLFQESTFCLQPQGDSYTRRSAFDAMVAGCVPVFFHPGSAYVQYTWHLPRDYKRWSVFVSEDDVREGKVGVQEVLMGIGEERARAMREEVVAMIPRLVYMDPRREGSGGVRDAFDVAVEGVIGRVERARREMRAMREGGAVNSSSSSSSSFVKFKEENSWKYELVGNEDPHEWDHFFFKVK